MTGRLPIHVNQQNNAGWGWTAAAGGASLSCQLSAAAGGAELAAVVWAVHPKFTMLPARLATRGYVSHQVGKWHLGLAKQAFTPVGRGFNTSLGVRPAAVCSLRVAQLEHSVLSISAASVHSISGERRSTTTTRPAAVSTCGHPIAPPSVTTACTLRSCTPLTRRS